MTELKELLSLFRDMALLPVILVALVIKKVSEAIIDGLKFEWEN